MACTSFLQSSFIKVSNMRYETALYKVAVNRDFRKETKETKEAERIGARTDRSVSA